MQILWEGRFIESGLILSLSSVEGKRRWSAKMQEYLYSSKIKCFKVYLQDLNSYNKQSKCPKVLYHSMTMKWIMI